MITLSEAAVKRVRALQAQRQTNAALRIGVKTGGCSGLSYTMDFVEELQPLEREYDCNGVKIVINDLYRPHLEGLELDYAEDLMGGGFRFHNPNAIRSCSCGTSFATPKDVGTPVACS